MGIFGDIMSKVFGGAKPAAPADTTPAADAAPAADTTNADAAAPAAPAAEAPAAPVDIEAVMEGYAAQNGADLNWKESIVDLLKLLGLDSSHEARLKLADELHYTGDKADSATMNVWLHTEVLSQLEKNGGKLPAGLHG